MPIIGVEISEMATTTMNVNMSNDCNCDETSNNDKITNNDSTDCNDSNNILNNILL